MFVRVSDGELDADVIVSGIAGTPAVTWGSASADGVANSVIRTDATLMYPPALIPVSGGTDTLTLTESGSDLTLTFGNSGGKTIAGSGGSAGFAITNAGQTSATNVLNITGDFDDAMTGLIGANWGGGTLTSKTVRCWDARYAAMPGVWTTATIIGFDTSAFSLTPTTGSATDNKAYCARLSGPLINNTNGGWTEVATLLLEAPRRFTTNPTVTLAGTIIAECPTVSATDQIGVYIKQRTAQTTATTRYGLKIDTHNSGTTRYAIWTGTDKCLLGGEAEIDGDLNHDGTNVGFYGVTPTARSSAYSPTNVTADRSYDANSTTVDELADVLGTLIADLQLTGIIG